MRGFVHSVDSLGTVDGPGIRFVIFLQGCPLRCKYCHNPDTWDVGVGNLMSIEELMMQYDGVSNFTKGGITVTGGEPLLQIDFVIELFKECKKRGIHTCLDTSGATFNKENTNKFDELIKVCDLVLLDLKHIDNEQHLKLTAVKNSNILDFARYLSDNNIDMWVRHVVIPGITLNDVYLNKLGQFLSELKNIKALDAIPYHNMANSKYKQLNIPIPLENTPQATKEQASYSMNVIVNGIKEGIIKRKTK